jgi:DNA-binding NarL/FixJ family response regulator
MIDALLQTLTDAWRLTPREAEIVRCVAVGVSSTKELATALGVAPATVDKHMESLSRKTGCGGRAELASRLLGGFIDAVRRIEATPATGTPLPRVAILDDEPAACSYISESLSAHGFLPEILDAEAPYVETFKLLKVSGGADVVVCDYVLPKTDGVQVAKHLAGDGLAAPVVVLITGYPERVALEAPHAVPHIVQKPLEMSELIRAVWEAALQSRFRRYILAALDPSRPKT